MRKKKTQYTFLDLTKAVLKQSNTPLTVKQIWDMGSEMGLIDKINTTGKTPVNTLQARLYIDIRDNDNTPFEIVSRRPTTFTLKGKNVSEAEIGPIYQDTKFKERDLHKLLSSFVYICPHFQCVTKTIFHEKTPHSKRGYNEWLHPDIVGVHFPFLDYSQDTLKMKELFWDNMFKLYSFEMKVELSFSNLREYFFQAVSNSSWANEGYLVVLRLAEDEELLTELRRLNNAFGIGVIKLNPESVSQSSILLQAKENKQLDWETIDRLMENPDFKSFINDFEEDVKIKKIKSKYDDYFEDDESAEEYSRKKNIL
ncbi:hypothetical protein SAMN05216390_10944 [Lachnospiraceae bacterium KH1T2]|nr:hypothetical protein SAMN05216390_10944 [Lachnospiraceae bacterium KH1T2]